MEFDWVMGCGLGWFVGPKYLLCDGLGWVGSVVWWFQTPRQLCDRQKVTKKVAICAALPLKAAHPASRSRLQIRGRLRKPIMHQPSAESGNTWLSIGIHVFDWARFRGSLFRHFFLRWMFRTVSNMERTYIGQSSALNEFVLHFSYVAPFRNYGDSNETTVECWVQISHFLTLL